jgi:hypothetical protein
MPFVNVLGLAGDAGSRWSGEPLGPRMPLVNALVTTTMRGAEVHTSAAVKVCACAYVYVYVCVCAHVTMKLSVHDE